MVRVITRLVPDFRENAFNFSPFKIMFAEGLSYIAFIMLSYGPSITDFWSIFINKVFLNYSMCIVFLDIIVLHT